MGYYLGVDGGGTKTEFLLVNEGGEVLGRRIKGGSNPNDIGIENAYNLFLEGIEELCKEADAPLKDTCVYVGGSGCGVGEFSKLLSSRLSKLVKKSAFSSDLPNVVELGLEGKDGIAVIAGTGSVFAVQKAGILSVVGGNGYLFEEYGSGFAIARAGFLAAFADVDGLGETTELTSLLEEKLGGSLKGRLNELYKGGKRYVAEFAPVVFKAAEQGDGVAQRILVDNAKFISDTLNILSRRFVGDISVALAGGIFKNASFLQAVRQGAGKNLRVKRSELPPVFGAVRLAVKLDEKSVRDSFSATLKESARTFNKKVEETN